MIDVELIGVPFDGHPIVDEEIWNYRRPRRSVAPRRR
jgi:hypothetical protein